MNTHTAAAVFTKVFRRAIGLKMSRPIRHQSKLHRQLTLIIVRWKASTFSSPAMKKTYPNQKSSVMPATISCICQIALKVRSSSSRSSRTWAIVRTP